MKVLAQVGEAPLRFAVQHLKDEEYDSQDDRLKVPLRFCTQDPHSAVSQLHSHVMPHSNCEGANLMRCLSWCLYEVTY